MLTFLGGGRGCAGALTRPSTRHLLPKNFEKTALRKRVGIFTVKMRGGHIYGNYCTKQLNTSMSNIPNSTYQMSNNSITNEAKYLNMSNSLFEQIFSPTLCLPGFQCIEETSCQVSSSFFWTKYLAMKLLPALIVITPGVFE